MSFSDFSLQLDFGDPVEEARQCRRDCALFDFSFIESARLQGPGALRITEAFANRRLADMRKGGIRYAVRTDREGNAVADLTVWRRDADTFEIMSGRREDIVELAACRGGDLTVTDLVPRSIFAIQGPGTLKTLSRLCDAAAISALGYFTFCEMRVGGIPCLVGRLGYTGERGFELIAAQADAAELWDRLSRVAQPAGFIAADILRIEAGLVLFANEFMVPVSPSEAGLGAFCRLRPWRQPRIELVSMQAETETASWPWRPKNRLSRPETVDAVVITSACRSVAADGVLALGYVRADMPGPRRLCDPAGIFTNIRLTTMPFLASAKIMPRGSWQ